MKMIKNVLFMFALTAALFWSRLCVQAEDISLKELYRELFSIGMAVPNRLISSVPHKSLLLKHFNSITMENEMKPDSFLDWTTSRSNLQLYQNSPAVRFSNAKAGMDFAKANGLPMRGHTLIWHGQTPEWFFHEDYDIDKPLASRERMLLRMENYIKSVMEWTDENYPGMVYAWDVVNEAIDDWPPGVMRESNWTKTIGSDFVTHAFRLADKYRKPGVKLFYNDYNEYSPAKRDAIIEMLRPAAAEGILDGMGMQSHLHTGQSISQFMEALRKYAKELDAEIHITELDVMLREDENGEYPQEEYIFQGQYYQELFEGLITARKEGIPVTNVTIWGMTDEFSWRQEFAPTLFNTDMSPKPAFDGVVKAVSKPEVLSVSVTPETAVVKRGETIKFTAIAEVRHGADDAVIWTVENNTSAGTRISAAGFLTVGRGEMSETLVVRAVSAADNKQSGTASVTVDKSEIKSVKITPNIANVKKGQTVRFTAFIDAVGEIDKTVSWRVEENRSADTQISKDGILKVSSDESSGYLIVRAVSHYDSGQSDTAAVIVAEDNGHNNNLTEVSNIKLNKRKITLGKKETFQLKAMLMPANAADKAVTWRSSKKSIVEVMPKGKIIAKKTGKAVITATAANGKSEKCTVIVKKAPKQITITSAKTTVKKGKALQLKTKLPKNTASYKKKWTSGNKAVAIVDANGKITAKRKGTVQITVKTFNKKKAVIMIRVK